MQAENAESSSQAMNNQTPQNLVKKRQPELTPESRCQSGDHSSIPMARLKEQDRLEEEDEDESPNNNEALQGKLKVLHASASQAQYGGEPKMVEPVSAFSVMPQK